MVSETVVLLARNQWVKRRHNILITGPTGAGKSYLACALDNRKKEKIGIEVDKVTGYLQIGLLTV